MYCDPFVSVHFSVWNLYVKKKTKKQKNHPLYFTCLGLQKVTPEKVFQLCVSKYLWTGIVYIRKCPKNAKATHLSRRFQSSRLLKQQNKLKMKGK